MTGVLQEGRVQTQRREYHVNTEAETRVMYHYTEEFQKLPATTRS